MDANYVMDETLGTASYDITKLAVGQTKMESFLIGKVRGSTPADTLAVSSLLTCVVSKTLVVNNRFIKEYSSASFFLIFFSHLTLCVCRDRITSHNQLLLCWTITAYFIVLTGNQSVLRDVTGDLVCILIKCPNNTLVSLAYLN